MDTVKNTCFRVDAEIEVEIQPVVVERVSPQSTKQEEKEVESASLQNEDFPNLSTIYKLAKI